MHIISQVMKKNIDSAMGHVLRYIDYEITTEISA